MGCYNSVAIAAPSRSPQGEREGALRLCLSCGWKSHAVHLLTASLLFLQCVFVQFNCECPRDRAYYSFRESYQGHIPESNQTTFSYLLFSHSSNFFNLFLIVINFSPYCAHAV